MKNSGLFILWTLLASGLLTGCGLYKANFNPQPLQKQDSQSLSTEQTPDLTAKWQESFKDAKLASLISAAITYNMDVRQAIARLRQIEAFAVQSRAERLPSVDAQTSLSREWEESGDQDSETRIGAALSWEIDAFGRLNGVSTARNLEADAAAEDIEAIRLSLSAEVAEAYFNAISQHLLLQLLQKQIEVDNQLLDLIRQRFEAGVGTNVEVLQQQSQLAENQSLIPPAEATLRVFENRLDVLTGDAPDGEDRTNRDDVFAKIGTLPALGVSSDLLLNRPDLRALKNRLVAADASIGVAIADRLPRITLDGTHLYASAGASPVSSLLAGLVQPLLDWGRRKAEVERNEALYQERLAAYTQAYLEAIENVENALYQENCQREFILRLEARRAVLDKTLKAAEATYRQGESDYMPVLNAVQDLRDVERNLITERRNLVLLRVQLFRALGGPVSSTAGIVENRNDKKDIQ